MKFKNLILILFTIILIGIMWQKSTDNDINKIFNTNTEYSINEQIINTSIVNFKYSDNEISDTVKKFNIIEIKCVDIKSQVPFGYVEPDAIIVYNFIENKFQLIEIKTGNMKDLYILQNGQRAVSYKYDNSSIVWAEDGEIEMNNIIGKNWGIYCYNILTGEILEIEKENELTTPPDRGYCATPNIFDFKDDYVAYILRQNYKSSEYSLLKLYDVKTKETLIVDSLEFNEYVWFSIPSISNENLVYSVSNAQPETFREFGEIYIYDIENKQKNKLETDINVLCPLVYNDYIICRLKPNGENENSEIYVYNISKNEWQARISNTNPLYDDYIVKPFELINLEIDNNMFIWDETTYGMALGIFDLEEFEMYPIITRNMDRYIIKIMFNNKMLLWNEYKYGDDREYNGMKGIIFE